jgi:hypothetical protein
MELLNNQYKLLKELALNTYLAEDINTNKQFTIKTYKAIDPSDWNSGAQINEELRKLRLDNEIDDYFYREDKKLNKKIFYKVNSVNSEEKKRENNLNKLHPKNRKNLILIPVCEKCNTPVSLRKINPTHNTAYCNKCHRTRSLIMMEPQNTVKQNLERPRRVQIIKTKNKLTFEMILEKGKLIGFLFILLFTVPYIKHYITGVIGTKTDLIILGSYLFLMLMIMIDRKYIEIKDGYLISGRKPFSFRKQKKLNIEKIEQLYVKKIGSSEFTEDSNYKDSKQYFDTYYLKAILNDNSHIVLYKTGNPKSASYLEYQIEKYLKIQDVIVKNEYDIDNDLAFLHETE